MATQTIQIKRSTTTATPPTLAVGELAHGSTGNLYIGKAGNEIVKVAGEADVTKLAGIEAGAQVNTVSSVNTKTGAVSLVKADVGLGNVDNTSDANKPISTAAQTALSFKANSDYPAFTGVVTGVTAAMVGLGNVNNTSDANKPVSTATQTALNLKADIAYVDSVATGLNIKDAVKTATTAAGTLATSFVNGAVIGGIAVATGDRILIKDQVDATQNGVYTVNATGAPTRAIDFDNTPGLEVKTGALVFVASGDLGATQWVMSTPTAIVIGTTNINFSQFSGGGTTYSAGTGLSLTGTIFALANHSAALLTSGTIPDARLSANVVLAGTAIDGGTF